MAIKMIKLQREQLLIGANIIIAVIVLIVLMLSIHTWHSDWQITHKMIQPMTINTTNQQVALIEKLPELHVFGKPVAKVSDVPISSLEFHVTGIAKVMEHANSSKAYISVSNQSSKVFHVGDTVSFGVRLYDVTDDAVVLENNGKLEKLPLQRNKLEFKSRSAKETN